jgi:cell fate regulator YaaT (PSP1 superfamily)
LIFTREETRRIGSIGACGEPICCYQFIDDFDPVNTQLVKEQNLPMNPTKISGVCGKLKCCFRYEHALYEEFLKSYPAYGSKVTFKDKTGIIEKIDIYQKTVTLKFENDEFEEIPLKEFDHHYKVID